ncbi:MAG: hypothetical protein ACRCTZ_19160 [Sarcina sp.]
MNLKTNIINEVKMYPENPIYFKEVEFSSFLELEEKEMEIERINSIKIWPEIENIEVIKTEQCVSNEGQKFTGTKLLITLKVSEKITYSGKTQSEPIHVIYNEIYKSLFIAVPEELKKLDIKALIQASRVVTTPYVENVYARKFNKRKIYKSACIFMEVKIC